MDRRGIVISSTDYCQLCEMLDSRLAEAIGGIERAEDLRDELSQARVVDAQDLPDDVVAMDDTVLLHWCETGETETYTLVHPIHADIANGQLSILAPVGTAILGHRVGEELHRRVPAGLQRFRIEKVIRQAVSEVSTNWPSLRSGPS